MTDAQDASFSVETGRVLRQIRSDQGLKLRDVAKRSAGRFKATTVGSYERGERALSLERFVELARLYGISAVELLRLVLQTVPVDTRTLAVDRGKLDMVDWPEREWLAEMADELATRRGQRNQALITFRAGDLDILATTHGREPAELRARAEPALVAVDEVRIVEDPLGAGDVPGSHLSGPSG